MLNNRIKKISNYIDQLNKEKKPNEHNKPMKDNEDEKLMETVRLIKSLKEVEYPKKEFNEQLTETLSKQFLNGNGSNNTKK
ncbi:hypothetical protein [Anaerocolumna sedimenticola]|uniref:hypothetical protein n=1 Tax=Anaerocolumna sedimenticola TaxID=2696063 RepID=UPI001FEBE80F|nr:hypothetical protein [Anaerocolumna sedimenticola]